MALIDPKLTQSEEAKIESLFIKIKKHKLPENIESLSHDVRQERDKQDTPTITRRLR
jgi:hypothetical protein